MYSTKYYITFKDILNNSRTIYIQEDGYSGAPISLIPGKNVIEWNEKNTEDLTSRVRGITGRIEVIEENYGDLADLFPKTPMQYRVVCQNVFWGYIKTQNSTNKWDAGPRSIKLNILSPLAMAYDIPMPINTTLGLRSVGDVMSELMQTLGYSYVVMPKGNGELGDFFRGQVRGMYICPYADDKDYHYANDNEVFAPISCGKFIEEVCKRHDLMAHDALEYSSPVLLLSTHGASGGMYRWVKSNIDSGNYGTATLIPTTGTDILSAFTVAGNNNNESLVQPYSYIDILHDGAEGGSLSMPTTQSDYLPNQDPYALVPRGIWLSNKNANIKLGEHEGRVDENSDFEYSDALLFNIYPNVIPANSLLFTLTFHQVDQGAQYRLKITYSHMRPSASDFDWLYISARGKNGWYKGNPTSGPYDRPIWEDETKISLGLAGDIGHNIPRTIYSTDFQSYMIADEYIAINVYTQTSLSNIYIRNIELEKRDVNSVSRHSLWAEQGFVRRILGEYGTRPLKITLGLNNTFFSNYYSTDYELLTEDTLYVMRSQRRIQITVRGGELDKRWYFTQYYFSDPNTIWKIIAIAYNVVEQTYKFTIHQINPYS